MTETSYPGLRWTGCRDDEYCVRGEAPEQIFDSINGLQTRLTEPGMAAIVQHDVGSAGATAMCGNAAFQPRQDGPGGVRFPVADDQVPLDGLQAERLGGAEDGRRTSSVRRAEEGDSAPERVF